MPESKDDLKIMESGKDSSLDNNFNNFGCSPSSLIIELGCRSSKHAATVAGDIRKLLIEPEKFCCFQSLLDMDVT